MTEPLESARRELREALAAARESLAILRAGPPRLPGPDEQPPPGATPGAGDGYDHPG